MTRPSGEGRSETPDVLTLYEDGEWRAEWTTASRSAEWWTPDGKQHHYVVIFGPGRKDSHRSGEQT